ncbi:MAG: ATP-dependent DNA helicase [Myxococcales bacterium]|jgi:ATP-dependent DNA helicase RecQ|nr:ATP-dependent DNA helicase [Myxococcales bacterium]
MSIDDNQKNERHDASPAQDHLEEKTPIASLSTPKPLSTPAAPLSVPKSLSTPKPSTPLRDPLAEHADDHPRSTETLPPAALSALKPIDEPHIPSADDLLYPPPLPPLPPIPGHWTERLPAEAPVQGAPSGKKRRRRRRRHVGPRDEVLVELRRFFHIQNFRPKQRDAIAAVLDGKDTLAIMPTGSGKSLTYQMAARIVPGLTIVISPLIALLRDQHEKLLKYGLDGVRYDSSLTPKQREKTLAALEAGEHKILLITPESIVADEFRSRIAECDVSLLVIDEAHCVSQWGHDFRPSYLALKKVAEDLGEPPILALTATATPKVQEDIIQQLGMEDPVRIVAPPDRPNLSFSVELHDSEMTKLRSILHHVRVLPKPGIIYCATTRDVEMVWAMLRKARIQAEYYHGKLLKSERDAAHSAFMSGRTPLVMVATNAFGLGVDKPNIRYVLHYQVPGSLEAYVQEAGRAGRDGKPSRCILLYDEKDLEIQEYFLEQQYPTRSQVRHVAEALTAWSERGEPVTLRDLALSAHVPQTRASVVLRLLQDMSFASEVEMGKAVTLPAPPNMEEVERAAAIYDVQRVHDRRRLGDLTHYATTSECRSVFIQRYFGAEDVPICGHCDNDMSPEEREKLDRETRAVMETPVTLKKKRHKERPVENKLDKKKKKDKARHAEAKPHQPQPHPHPHQSAAQQAAPGAPALEGESARKKRRRRRKKKHLAGQPPQSSQQQQQQLAMTAPGASVRAESAPTPTLPAEDRRAIAPSTPPLASEPAVPPVPRYATPLESGGDLHTRHRRRRHRGGRTFEIAQSESAATRPAAAVEAAPPPAPAPKPEASASPPRPAPVAVAEAPAVERAPAESPRAKRVTVRRSKKTEAVSLPEPFARAAENLKAILAAAEAPPLTAPPTAPSPEQAPAPRKPRATRRTAAKKDDAQAFVSLEPPAPVSAIKPVIRRAAAARKPRDPSET